MQRTRQSAYPNINRPKPDSELVELPGLLIWQMVDQSARRDGDISYNMRPYARQLVLPVGYWRGFSSCRIRAKATKEPNRMDRGRCCLHSNSLLIYLLCAHREMNLLACVQKSIFSRQVSIKFLLTSNMQFRLPPRRKWPEVRVICTNSCVSCVL